MNGGQQAGYWPLRELIAAYEAGFPGEGRHVLSFVMTSCMPKMKKWIIEYAVTSVNEHGERLEENVIGKVFSDHEKGQASYRIMKYLWENGMNLDPRYTIVRPIAYIEAYNVMLMSKAPGTEVKDWLHEGSKGEEAASHAAEWLIRLHRVPVLDGGRHGRTRAEADTVRIISELCDAVPDKAAELRSFGERLHRQEGRPHAGATASVMLHGDFHVKNIFWDGTRATAIDFDHHFVGDAAWDVAYHACQIQLSAFFKQGDFHRFRPAVRNFLDTYLAAVPESQRGTFLTRLSCYRSRSLLESLHYELCVCKTGAFHIVDSFLEECGLSLQGQGKGLIGC
ncbi:phosphotransferase family protein [Paenibacillus thermotolerans]|uniref:phosphotransferase family protein n=1 Tax=Paenibacillus thermotolerans TaxID=3027807 RepID=UPI0023674AF2|nr:MULTISPECIES: aminoglycoside phosphotransferase family protein [unclassified Paenibacillus]